MADSDAPSSAPSDTIGLRPNRACRNCVQIKAKCVPVEGSDPSICQRCYRLRKTCSTAAPAAKRKPKAKNRVLQLEARLNEITTLLASIQKQSSNDNDVSLPTPSSLSEKPAERPPDWSDTVIFGRCLSPTVAPDAQPSEASSLIPQPGSGVEEALLREFRDRLNYFFPFVILPRDDMISLRKARPNLFRACVYAAARQYPIWQRQLAEATLRQLSEGMLMYGERSLDLLQGLLVFISWYHYHGHINPQLMNLMHLAMSLVVDLGLGSSTARFHSSTANTISTDAERIIHGKAVARGVKTNEERRAVLACYYMTTTYSFCFHKLDYMRFTPHLEQCCSDLAAAHEYPSDSSLVAIVRFYEILEKYVINTENKQQSTNLPLSMFVKLYNQEMDSYLDTLPDSTKLDELFDLHLLSCQVCFYESTIPLPSTSTFDKITTLSTALTKVSAYFTAFLTQYTSMSSIPYFYWMRIIHSLSVLTKLSFLNIPGWDLEYVRSTVPFCDLIDKLNEKLWAVHEAESSVNARAAFTKRFRAYRAKLDRCKFWFGEMVAQEARARANLNSTATETAGADAADGEAGQEQTQSQAVLDFNDPMLFGMLENLDEYLNFDFMEGGVRVLWFKIQVTRSKRSRSWCEGLGVEYEM